jgi:predicted membrane protein
MEKSIKIILAVAFFICLFNMPYGYYELVRFAALVGFGILAYNSHKNNNTAFVVIYVALALLFQPFFKIALGRTLWNIVDVVVGLFLIISLIKNKEENK